MFAFLDDHSRLLPRYRWGYARRILNQHSHRRSHGRLNTTPTPQNTTDPAGHLPAGSFHTRTSSPSMPPTCSSLVPECRSTRSLGFMILYDGDGIGWRQAGFGVVFRISLWQLGRRVAQCSARVSPKARSMKFECRRRFHHQLPHRGLSGFLGYCGTWPPGEAARFLRCGGRSGRDHPVNTDSVVPCA